MTTPGFEIELLDGAPMIRFDDYDDESTMARIGAVMEAFGEAMLDGDHTYFVFDPAQVTLEDLQNVVRDVPSADG